MNQKKRNNKCCFITLEGGDGAGKSLVIDRLEEALRMRHLPVLKTRNPGGTPIGERIRELILHEKQEPATTRCELLLYLADRAQHVDTVILPALKEGKIILCDRFNDSTLAYQAAGRGLELEEVRKLCAFAADDLVPDLTLYFDIEPKVGLRRIQKMGHGQDRLEIEKLAFHEAVRRAYLALAQQEKERFRTIDASAAPDEVFDQSLHYVDELLTKKTH